MADWEVASESPAQGSLSKSEFKSVMNKTFGPGRWNLTSGHRSTFEEDKLRAKGAGTVPKGHISAHSEGTDDAPGAYDFVVPGMSQRQAAAKLAQADHRFDQVFAEGAQGSEGTHVHAKVSLTAAKSEAAANPSKVVSGGWEVAGETSMASAKGDGSVLRAGPPPGPLGQFEEATRRRAHLAFADLEKARRWKQPSPFPDAMNTLRKGADIFGVLSSPVGGAAETLARGVFGKSDDYDQHLAQQVHPNRERPIDQRTYTDEQQRHLIGDVAELFTPVPGPRALRPMAKVGEAVAAPIIARIVANRGAKAQLSAGELEILSRLKKGEAPTAQEMLDLAKKTPHKPITIMDVGGPNVRGLAGKVARSPGPGKAAVSNYLVERSEAQQQRLESDVGKIAKGSAHETIEALKTSRQAAAKPLYDQAYAANPVIHSAVIDEIVRSDVVKPLLSRALKSMQADTAGANIARGDKYSLQALDYTKRELDDEISAAVRAGANNKVRVLQGLKHRLVDELDTADKTGAYAKARSTFSGSMQSQEAVEFGRERALKNPVEINAKVMAAMTPGDREFARLGFAQALRADIAKHNLGTNAARNYARRPDFQERVRPLFSSQKSYDHFIDSVTAEHLMFDTHNKVLAGSQTAERVVEDNHGVDAALGMAQGAARVAGGNHMGGAAQIARAIGDYVTRPKPETASEIAAILTSDINQAGSAGARFLRKYEAHVPKTRNFLAQAAGRAARGQ